jgi:hypothetical protein
MDRRQSLKWLGGLTAFLLPLAASGPSWARAEATPGSPLSKPKSEWADLLPAASYRVLFEEDTERAGSSPLNQEKRDGTFICAACYLPLFDSSTKYESGTGWPSFWQHLPRGRGHQDRLQGLLSAYRIPLRALRRAPGACFQRRPQTDGQALLQQWRRAAIRCRVPRSCRRCGHEPATTRDGTVLAGPRGTAAGAAPAADQPAGKDGQRRARPRPRRRSSPAVASGASRPISKSCPA